MNAPRSRVTWQRTPVRAGVSVLMAFVAACAAGEPPPARPNPDSTVDSLIGDAPCDADSQCRTIAVGAKACGGPQGYRAWSSRSTDSAALQGAADREAQVARTRIEKSGIMSNCAMAADPGAYCTAPAVVAGVVASAAPGRSSPMRQCRLRPSGSGGAAKIY